MKIQRQSVLNLARRLFGIQGEASPADVEDYVLGVCELGRRGEFELLREQGIIAWHTFGERTPAAGQNAHCYVMASLIGGTRYHVVFERAVFAGSAATSIRGFQGTALGATVSNVILARDLRHTDNGRTDFSALLQSQDGETAVVPPAVGVKFWQGRLTLNGPEVVWHGPVLIPHIDEFSGVQGQIAFQAGTAAARIEYTFSGYLVPLAGQK